MTEQSLVLIKPDGVERGLTGVILERLMRAGLKISALRMLKATRDQADRHYALTEEWMMGVFSKAKAKYDADGKEFPYADHKAYGKMIKDGLVEFLSAAPIIAMIVEGEQAVSLVRKIVGATEPASAAPGTIRGDYSLDTYALSNAQLRPIRNLIHASGTVDEATHEASIWFTPQEIHPIQSAQDPILYSADRYRA